MIIFDCLMVKWSDRDYFRIFPSKFLVFTIPIKRRYFSFLIVYFGCIMINMIGRHISVKLHYKSHDLTLETTSGRALKGFLSVAGITADLPCGGNGRCGRCKVRFLQGAPAPTALESSFLTKEDVEQGIRLLCRCVLGENCVVDMTYGAVAMEAMEAETAETVESKAPDYDSYGVAIDIGTTTLAAALIGAKKDADGRQVRDILKTSSCVNRQRQYGADVISRISACEDPENARVMRQQVLSGIKQLINELTKELEVKPSIICLAGNTTMLHILRGKNTAGLGVYPYRTDGIADENITIEELFGAEEVPEGAEPFCRVIIFPGISAFVGADIVAGLFYIRRTLGTDSKESFLLADLGTNGEMAYFDGERYKVTSTAAGPVFEGGSISCGMPSTAGAIEHIHIDEVTGSCSFETIGGGAPLGLCGSGVMEAAAELVRVGIADETGLLRDDYFEKGYLVAAGREIFFTQQDIRNVQLAKAAINSGMRAILGDAVPDKVFVAGGYGSHMDVNKLGTLNMFPKELLTRVIPLGNTSLKGCIELLGRYLYYGNCEAALSEAREIAERALETVLADSDSFGDDYIDAMNFRK
jgi:uncharacterized 2Fe-2S/4Fe-4S cluster protein (DUF4445 family)